MRTEDVPVEKIEPGETLVLPSGREVEVERVEQDTEGVYFLFWVGGRAPSTGLFREEENVERREFGSLVGKRAGETWKILRDERQGTLDQELRAASEPPLEAGTGRREPPPLESRLADDPVPASSEPVAAEPALISAAGGQAPEGDAPRARSSDPETSHAAAASVRNISATQATILEIFNVYGPMSDDELVALYQWMSELGEAVPQASESGIRTRRSELVEAHEVMDLDQVRTLESGRKAIIWGLPRQYDPARAEIPFPARPEPPL